MERKRSTPSYLDCRLTVFENPSISVSTTKPLSFREAVATFLRSSLSEFLLQVVYPQYNQEAVYAGVPTDIQLRHVLIRLPSIQSTGFPDDFTISSLIAQLIASMKCDIDLRGEANHVRHARVLHATFHTLASVVSNAFVEETLPASERQRLLHPLFTALLLDVNLSAQAQSLGEKYKSLTKDYHTWMTDLVANKIVQAIFVEAVNLSKISPLLSDLLQSVVHFGCTKLLARIYKKLCSRHWLEVICAAHFDQTRSRPTFIAKTSHSFIAAAFIEGLDILKQISTATHAQIMDYIRTPSNLLSFSKILMLSDVERRKGLETLVPLVSAELWKSSLQDLDVFMRCPAVRDGYECHRSHARHPLTNCLLPYKTHEEVLVAVSDFRRDCQQQRMPWKAASRPRNKVNSYSSSQCIRLIRRI